MTHDPPLPPIFAGAFDGLVEIRPPSPQGPYHQCFGCGAAHPDGLSVRCFASDGEVRSPILIPARFAGPPGAAHGGIVAAYLDEVLAAAALGHAGRVYVTGELTVRYVKPTPVEWPLLGRGRLVRDSGKYVDLQGHIETLDTREVVATATGRFFPMGKPKATSTPS